MPACQSPVEVAACVCVCSRVSVCVCVRERKSLNTVHCWLTVSLQMTGLLNVFIRTCLSTDVPSVLTNSQLMCIPDLRDNLHLLPSANYTCFLTFRG